MNDAEVLATLNSEVQQLHVIARPDIFKPVESTAAAISQDFRERVLAKPEGQTLILEVDGEPVGYVCVQAAERQETPYAYGRTSVHIDQIGVKASHQGQGYGRMLLEAVFEMARQQNIRRVTLSSWAFNSTAHQFFEHNGFVAYTLNFETFLDDHRR